jgi:hypothetical protein
VRNAGLAPAAAGAHRDPQWPGIYDAIVVNSNDPLNQGRVRLGIPQVLGNTQSNWATPMQPGITPAVGQIVYALFLGGNPNLPQYFLGITSTVLQSINANTGLVLNSNPYFTGNLITGWTATGGTLSGVQPNQDTNPPYVYGALWIASGSGGGYITEAAGPFAAGPAQPYLVTAWVYYPAGGSVNIGVQFENASKAPIGSPVISSYTVSAGVWTYLSTTVSSPALSAFGYPVIGPAASTTGEQFTAEAVQVLGQIPGALIEAATITTTQLGPSVTARALGGITTTIAASAPASPTTGDIWINTSNGNQIEQWSGSAWVPITWTATDVIQAGTITASLIAANTIVAGNIAAGTITAAQIAAGTITATKLASGIVVAGIVDATTITGAKIIADGSSGDFLVYSGTPALGNLNAAISPGAFTDPVGNIVPAGSNFGNWGGTGALLNHYGIDTSGNTYLCNNAGSTVVFGQSNDGTMLFYSPSAANGNLAISIAPVAGSDTYGNAYPAGLSVNAGIVQGVALNASTVTANPGPVLVYGNPGTITVYLSGSGNWTAPAGVTSVFAECWGGGAAGGTSGGGVGASGGGGGEYAAEPNLSVTPGNNYAYTVGGTSAASTMAGNSTTVTAHGATGNAGGSGSGNSIAYGGGQGGTTSSSGGGGGAGSAGTGSMGNHGGSTSTSSGGKGSRAVAGGGAGGTGGNNGANGSSGQAPGGGGGGAGQGTHAGGAGTGGQIRLTYTPGGVTALIASLTSSPGTDPSTGTAYPGPGLGLADAGGTPNGLTGWTTAYATTAGNLDFVSGSDGNSYSTGRASLILASTQSISSTTPAPLTGLSAAVAVGAYRVHGWMEGSQGATAAGQIIGFTGPATTAPTRLFYYWVQQGVAQQFSTISNSGLLTTFTSPAYGAGDTFLFYFDGVVTFSSPGTLTVIAAEGTATDNFSVIAGSFIDIMPIS